VGHRDALSIFGPPGSSRLPHSDVPRGVRQRDLRFQRAMSSQIREIFAEHTPIIEPLSLDEAYLDVTENLQGIPLARDIALRIREKIKAETGLNASAGISYNKFLAKLASDHRKPNGQFVISPEMGPAFVESLPLGKFHGIGPATSRR
jgi:DNA polymerase IV